MPHLGSSGVTGPDSERLMCVFGPHLPLSMCFPRHRRYRHQSRDGGGAHKKEQGILVDALCFCRREWNRTTDPYRVKVVL